MQNGIDHKVDRFGNESLRQRFILKEQSAQEEATSQIGERPHSTQAKVGPHQYARGGDNNVMQIASRPKRPDDAQKRELW